MYAPGTTTTTGTPSTDPVAYLKATWAAFEGLFPSLLALQHRAANLAARLPEGPKREEARASVDAIARLIRIQAATVRKVEEYGSYIGLGAMAIPPAILAALTALALIVAWVFRAYAAQERILDMIEAGTLTPEQAANIKEATGPAPGLDILGGLAQVGGVGALIIVALALLFLARRWRGNPDLLTFHDNPGGVWSHRVYDLRYVHDDDGENYIHEFKPGVRLQGLPDGSVRLFHPRRRLWEDF